MFIKGLAEIEINKTLIKNDYLFAEIAKEEHKMPESQSDDESDCSVVESDNSDDEKESVNDSIQSDSDEEMEGSPEKLSCDHFENIGYWFLRFMCERIFVRQVRINNLYTK